MEREEFIKSLGISLAVVCAGSCLTACSKSAPITPTGTTGGTTSSVSVDLSTMPNVGNQIIQGSVLFFRIAAGNAAASFVATEAVCPHQGGTLKWLEANNFIQCQLHQSEYKPDGSIIQGPQGVAGSTRALKLYAVSIAGTKVTATTATA